MLHRKVIIFAGYPGSGKGTIGALCSKHFKIPHISTGDLIRQEIANETEYGKLLSSYVNKGLYAPSSLTDTVFANRLKQDDCENGFIWDGYPRSIDQYHDSSRILDTVGGKIEGIIVLDVSKDVCQERLRMMDRGRNDDNPESQARRFDHYESQTKLLFSYPPLKDKIFPVNAEGTIEDTFVMVHQILDKLLK